MLLDAEVVAVKSRRQGRALPIVILLLALTPALAILLTHLDLPLFGTYQDDGLLLINAKSLSEGRGFRILSLPGEPHQTKYQPLLPLLQAGIWRLNPRFPDHLPLVALLQTATFLAFLFAARMFFRAAHFSPLESAALTGGLALSPLLIYWAAVPTVDFLFAALCLAAFLALDRRWYLAAGLLTSAAYLAKSTGLLLVPAILLTLLLTRQWKEAARFLAPVLPTVLAWTLWASQHKAPPGHAVLAYYTDYVGYLVRSGGVAALGDIVPANAVSLCTAAGSLLLHDMGDSLLGRFFAILVAAATVTGGVRWAKRTGSPAYPLYCLLLAGVLCAWNFSPSARLILPLAPLVIVGLYLEAQNFTALARQALRQGGANRVVGVVLIILVGVGLLYTARQNFAFVRQTIPGVLAQSRQKAQEMTAVHRWMAAHLPPASVVMASEDTTLYLRTGLRAVRPVPNSVAFYRQDRRGMLDHFAHPEKLERAFGITHILLGPAELATDFEPADQREAVRLLRQHPRHHSLYEGNGYSILAVR